MLMKFHLDSLPPELVVSIVRNAYTDPGGASSALLQPGLKPTLTAWMKAPLG